MSMGGMGMPPPNGMPLGGMMGGGGAGIPDMEQMQGMDPAMAQAIAAGATMGMSPDGTCPACGYPMAQDGSCPLCGMGSPSSGPGAMAPEALSALLGGGGGMLGPGMGAGMGPMDGAVPPPGDVDTSGAEGDQANLQQLVAILSLLKQQGASPGGMPPGMMPPGAGAGMPPSGMGPPLPPGGGKNPIMGALGGGR